MKAVRSWDTVLLDPDQRSDLVTIAREGRLVRHTGDGPIRVQLTPIDESVLALVDRAMAARKDVTFVYPGPAGDVSVLLAAEILLRAFVRGDSAPAVGILTADPMGAARTWDALRIASPGSRTPVSEVFPCWRSGPDGRSPFGRQRRKGVVIGNRFSEWSVDLVVVDHMLGQVADELPIAAVHLFADPLDPAIAQLVARGTVVWAWSPGDLAAWLAHIKVDLKDRRIPFSVSQERLATLASGVHVTIRVAHDELAEQCISRLRDDLRTMARMAGSSPTRTMERGIRVAWHHLSTLTSLPCRPSDFDRFAGLPPVAARSTASFEPEIAAWSRALIGDAADIAGVIASDLSDLRVRLEETNPFFADISASVLEDRETLVVVRTHTAARGLLNALGADPSGDGGIGKSSVRSVQRLHRERTYERAVIVGTPPRWDWHKIDSGLSREVHVLVLGDVDARMGVAVLNDVEEARRKWGGPEMRSHAWRELVGGSPPETSNEVDRPFDIHVEGAREGRTEADPFAEFERLFVSGPLLVGDEGVEEYVAQEVEDGLWEAAVQAVEVVTDAGVIRLPARRSVEVRVGDRIVDCRAEDLKVGMYLLIGRRAGRVGLLEALAERLKHRPDLFAATLLVTDLQGAVRQQFRTSRMSKTQLYARLREAGFEKTIQAARGYVEEGGPLAPRDLEDLRRVNAVLRLGFSDVRVREVFGGVSRLRNFRRSTGRALAAAARGATVATGLAAVDPDTGLSLADLRDVVIEAAVAAVHRCPEPVLLADLDRLEVAE